MYPLTIALAVESRALWDEVRASLHDLPVRVLLEEQDIGAFLEGMERVRPDVVLVDISESRDRVEHVVQRLRVAALSPMVIALHSQAEPETILAALRAGANEYIYPPLESSLREALERLSEERSNARAGVRGKGKAIAFLSAKGGCGATTIACHVALELGRHDNCHTLLADLDLGVGMVRFLMRCTSTYSVVDAVNNLHRLDVSYWKALVSNGYPGVEVIAAPPAFPVAAPPEPAMLRHVLSFARSQYDWIVADLGRNLTPLTLAAFEEIDEVYLVTTPDVPALHQAKLVFGDLVTSDYGRNRIRLILNRAAERPDITPDDAREMLGHPIYAVLPEDSNALFRAFCAGKLLPPGSKLGARLAQLAREIAGMPETPERPRFRLLRRGRASLEKE